MTVFKIHTHMQFVSPRSIVDASGNATISSEKTYQLYGYTAWGVPYPKAGDTVEYELLNSVVVFEIESVKSALDPPDMFFADVKPIERRIKGE